MEDNKKKVIYDKFGIGNFKSFQDVQEIDIAPITLIFGQNSGGKTSLLQSILSLSQSFEEISEGKFQLSGTKIDAGTFETALNNKAGIHEIILDISNKEYKPSISEEQSNSGFFIETFRPILNSKIRLYIRSDKETSNVYISKIEINFSGYLDGLKLTFKRDNSIFFIATSTHAAFAQRKYPKFSLQFDNNLSTTYKLESDSKAVVKEITERCFNNLCDNFKQLFAKRKKGSWFNQNTNEYSVHFGKMLERIFSRKVNENFLCFIKHAAIASGAHLYGRTRKTFDIHLFFLKEFKHFDNKTLDRRILKIIEESSSDIFRQSLNIFESDKGFFPIHLETFIYKDRRGVFFRERKNRLQNKFDSIAAEMSFVSNYTGTKKIFDSNNIFRKIELIQDLYIEKISKINLFNFPDKELVLKKYYAIKDSLITLNSEFVQIEDEFYKVLDSFRGGRKKKLTSLQNRKNLRENLKRIYLENKLNIRLNLKNLKDDIRTFINKLNLSSLENDISDQLEGFNGLNLITDLFEEILVCHKEFINASKNNEITTPKLYVEKDDEDINYLKIQLINSFRLGFLFRKLINSIQIILKNELIKALVKKDILKNNFSDYSPSNTLIWLLSSEYFEDEIDYQESESIKEDLLEHFDKEFPLVFPSVLEEYINEGKFANHLNHLIPSPFLNLSLIPPKFNTGVVHLGPSRPGAKRFYTNQDIERAEPDDVAYFLKTQLYKDKGERLNINLLNNYLSKLDIIAAILADKSEDQRYDFKSILVTSNKNSKPVNLADTGYGLSQLFPIIINAITRSSNTILVQQPETHLHPRLQAEVGSILVDSIRRFNFKTAYGGKSWIVETHSEIMLLRILKRIRNGDFKAENLRVYYVDQSKEKGSVIKRMEISKEGEMISQWPKGFFSNDIDEMFDL